MRRTMWIGLLSALGGVACQSDADRCIREDLPDLCEKACEGGHDRSCLKLGALYGVLSKPEQGLKAFRRACALGMEDGCYRARQLEQTLAARARADGLADCDKIGDRILARLDRILPGDPGARKEAEAGNRAARVRAVQRCREARLGKAVEACVDKARGLKEIERCLAAGK